MFAALALLASVAAAEPVGVGPITVVDGDTVEQGGQRWRLDGIDAPEIHAARCEAERERGIKGAARLIDLVAQRGARIVPVVTRTGRVASGGFGRRLGRLVLGDGVAWGDIAVAEGHAVAWAYRHGLRRHDWCAGAGS